MKNWMPFQIVAFFLIFLVTPMSQALAAPVVGAEKAPAASPEDGGPRYWQVVELSGGLNLREQPTSRALVLTRFTSGRVLDNLGCLWAEGRIWCNVQELGGVPRGYVAADYLKPAVAPDGTVATGADTSAARAGQGRFDATGMLSCALLPSQPIGHCGFGVARSGGGDTTVLLKKPDSRTRAIFFRFGNPVGADTSKADPGQFSATRQGAMNFIRVGNERYEIPDAVVLGD